MDNNIIAFPGAKPELVLLAQQALQNGDPQEATKYFQQAFTKRDHEITKRRFITEEQIFSEDILLQIQWILSLDDKSVHQALPLIRKYLSSNRNPILQTLLLMILKTNMISDFFSVHKFDKTETIVPLKLINPEDSQFLYEISDFLHENLEHSEPSLYEQSIYLIHEHNLILFPLQLPDLEQWKHVYLFYIKTLVNIPQILPDTQDFWEKLQFIKLIEKYSINFFA